MSDRLYDLFERAADLDPERRDAFIAAECGDDTALASRLKEMLEDSVASGFLSGRLDTDISEDAPSPGGKTPERIGAYRILGVIGRGGMGIVYEAQQERPARRVALKVIRRGVATPAVLRRFEREARVLGQLQHAGIAQSTKRGPRPRRFDLASGS